MDPVTAAAVVTSGVQLARGVMESRGNNRAMSAQERANSEAIRYQRERDASQERREYAAYQEYRQRYDEWINRFYGGNQSSGSTVSGGGQTYGSASSGRPQAQQPAGRTLGSGGMPPAPTGAPVAPLGSAPAVPGTAVLGASSVAGVPPLVPGTPQQPRTLADLSGWNDWSRYGA